MSIIMSIVGILFLLFIGFCCSSNRKLIKPRTILGALAIQLSLGMFVMYVPIGQTFLSSTVGGVQHVINYANEGLAFVFGDLSKYKVGFIFALNVLCVVIFVSTLISVLYYLKIMQVVINIIGGGLAKLLGTSKAESLSATANIFVGPIEAPSMVRPIVPKMTQSELFAVMTGGLASVAGGTMIGYINLGIDPKYIITACFMTAPAGLLFAKLMYPEHETPTKDIEKLIVESKDNPTSLLNAITHGSAIGAQQVATVAALLISMVALIALVNGLLGGIGGLFGFDNVTIQSILGYVLSPLAFLMGVEWSEAIVAASFIGQKIAVNEFVAYADYKLVADSLSEKTQAIVTFSLCGFANIGSLAMVIGGIGSMCPSRREDITKIGGRVLMASILANLMSGTIAGLLISLDVIL
ncbi:NupC/NupG family nucleoside CNT transporter [Vibrio parahaemolyticus]|nr:NupC/NupG family nucleoside CNT transporter [Vibrio parahaemolyticus]